MGTAGNGLRSPDDHLFTLGERINKMATDAARWRAFPRQPSQASLSCARGSRDISGPSLGLPLPEMNSDTEDRRYRAIAPMARGSRTSPGKHGTDVWFTIGRVRSGLL